MSEIEIRVLTVVSRVAIHFLLQPLTKYSNAASGPRSPETLYSSKTKAESQSARYLCKYKRIRGAQRKTELPQVEGNHGGDPHAFRY